MRILILILTLFIVSCGSPNEHKQTNVKQAGNGVMVKTKLNPRIGQIIGTACVVYTGHGASCIYDVKFEDGKIEKFRDFEFEVQ